jgi:glycerol uptake facilitator-like aquaporin
LYSFASKGGDITSLFLGIFILIVLSAKISGSHYNPAITLAFMFRKDTGRFSRFLGFAYFLFQIAGAFAGSLLYLLFTGSGGNL